MFIRLANFLRAQYPQFGFREVITPTMYKKSLWETSGHWDKYAKDMYSVVGRRQVDESNEFGLKPMNCPGHCLVFASETRSWRDLPIRYADFSALHRNETTGSLSGLTRVRRFHQDDGHIFCRPTQIQEEIQKSLNFVSLVYKTFNVGPYKLVLSTRPDDYIGQLSEWNAAERQLVQALEDSGQEWTINKGDGAFYGPKIDIILSDSDGKEHQTATIQLDFQLPKRFNLTYQGLPEDVLDPDDPNFDPNDKTPHTASPIMIHRAIYGSLERFLALLIEHYNGVYPLWLSPHPATILSISSDPAIVGYVQKLCFLLNGLPPPASLFPAKGDDPDLDFSSSSFREMSSVPSSGIQHSPTRVSSLSSPPDSDDPLRLLPLSAIHALPITTNTASQTLQKKLVDARNAGYNFILVAGKREAKNGTVNIQIANQRNKERAREILWRLVTEHGEETTKDGKGAGLNPDGPVEVRWQEARSLFGSLVGEYA